MISFEPTDEERSLQDTVGRFAQLEIRPRLREAEDLGAVPPVLIARAQELGLSLLDYPESVGGLGLGMRSRVLVEEELAAGDLAIAQGLGGPEPAGHAVLEMGTPDQQARWLPGFATEPGRKGALAVTEAQPGFCLSQTATTAVRTAAGYRLDGCKSFIDYGDAADPCVVVARMDDGALGLFAVGAGTLGRRVSKRHEKLGLRAIPSVELVFENCAIPASGKLDGTPFSPGFERTLARIRVITAAQAVGVARAAFEYAARYAVERQTFGRAIAEHQGIAFLVAEMGTEVEAARSMVWRAAWSIDRSESAAVREAALALAQASEAAMFVTNNAVQVLGGHGYIQDHPVEKWFRDAKMLVLSWGSVQSLNRSIASTLPASRLF